MKNPNVHRILKLFGVFDNNFIKRYFREALRNQVIFEAVEETHKFKIFTFS